MTEIHIQQGSETWKNVEKIQTYPSMSEKKNKKKPVSDSWLRSKLSALSD